MSKTLSARLFFVLLLFGTVFFLTGCGNSGSSGDKPPSYSPARVLTPEAPGKQTLGSSPLILDISNQDQGYLTAESDSDDSRIYSLLPRPMSFTPIFWSRRNRLLFPFRKAPEIIPLPVTSR